MSHPNPIEVDIKKLRLHFQVRTDTELALAMGVAKSSVASWKRRGHVPEWHLSKLEAAAPGSEPPERIVAAAVFHGCTVSLPPPARHHTILHSIAIVWGQDTMRVDPANQGFLTSRGRFVNRTEAFHIAQREGQLINLPPAKRAPELFSEDLW